MIDEIKSFAAEAVYFRTRARFHHWNVEGPQFIQDHEYLGEIYNNLDEEVDQVAEFGRKLGHKFPSEIELVQEELPENFEKMDGFNISQFMWDRLGKDSKASSSTRLRQLTDRGVYQWFEIHELNKNHIENLKSLGHEAETSREQGIANAVDDWVERHDEIHYFTGSLLGTLN